MLSSHGRLMARESSKPGALSREAYLEQLMKECTHPATSADAREQCLAHLANFSYDPINFVYFLRLNIVDMFVDCLDEALPAATTSQGTHSHQGTMARLAMQGICNVAPDPRFQKIICENDAIPLIVRATNAGDTVTMAAALATLFFLLDASLDMVPPPVLRTNTAILVRVKECSLHEQAIVRNTAFAFLTRQREIQDEEK
ncbi:Armadillo repeat-containing protein 7 [Aphanomyces cochlioides]|nr:Armadillo repeat-containing protein 7 [Aphanomyces cochlioides]